MLKSRKAVEHVNWDCQSWILESDFLFRESTLKGYNIVCKHLFFYDLADANALKVDTEDMYW